VGLIGVIIALFAYARKHRIDFFALGDFVAPLVPTGLLFGRLGNFIGQELYGRPTDLPWAMLFPSDPLQLPRHPSQLYEALLEGVVLFFIVHYFARKPRLFGQVAGLFLIFYGLFRFLVEFVRQPDAQFAAQPGACGNFRLDDKRTGSVYPNDYFRSLADAQSAARRQFKLSTQGNK
jgi:phosphatidylglycerol:prolipoprotein diacylglycerol transferase